MEVSQLYKILLLEDSVVDAELLERALTKEDLSFSLKVVSNRKEFEEAIHSFEFDIILTDFNLQNFTGLQALELAKEKNEFLPVIVVSGSVSPKEQVHLLKNNADDILNKSDLSKLPFIVRRAVNEAARRKLLDSSLEKIKKAMREREILVGEIHHRVKNNLAVISGILELCSFDLQPKDPVYEMLRGNILRIKSIALVHECLYNHKGLTHLNVSNFFTTLKGYIENVYTSRERDIQIALECDDILLNINQAVPLGLVLSELITNSLKHAFEKEADGDRILISCRSEGGKCHLIVKDNGVGLPKDFNFDSRESFGSNLVTTLAKQLEGTLTLEPKVSGTHVKLVFPILDKKGSSNALTNTTIVS